MKQTGDRDPRTMRPIEGDRRIRCIGKQPMKDELDAASVARVEGQGHVAIPAHRRETTINCNAAIAHLEEALRRNRPCVEQLIAPGKAFAMNPGPSGGPEALAVIHCDDLFADSFWYGHVMQHPHQERMFIAMLMRSSRFLNARNVPLLFQRHHHWMMSDPQYQPAAVQSNEDAYAERFNFEQAVLALGAMIDAFDPEMRSGYEGGPSEGSRCEMRILNIYGIAGKIEEDGLRPPIPDIIPLSVVT